MAEEKNENEIQIDLGGIFSFLLRKLWLIILCMVVGAGAGYTYASLTKTDTYSTSATYIVYYNGGENISDAVTYQSRVASVLGGCVTFVKQNRFSKIVAEEMNRYGIHDITASQVYSSVSYAYATNAGNTITITARSTDPVIAYNTLIAVTNLFADYLKDNYRLAGDDSLVFSLANDIEMPVTPVSDTSVLKYTVFGALGSTGVCVIVLALIVIFDQRVKGEDDLVNKYDIAVLGSVPNFEDKDLMKREKY